MSGDKELGGDIIEETKEARAHTITPASHYYVRTHIYPVQRRIPSIRADRSATRAHRQNLGYGVFKNGRTHCKQLYVFKYTTVSHLVMTSSTANDSIRVWATSDGRSVQTPPQQLSSRGAATCIKWTWAPAAAPNNELMVFGTHKGYLVIWSYVSSKVRIYSRVQEIGFNPLSGHNRNP